MTDATDALRAREQARNALEEAEATLERQRASEALRRSRQRSEQQKAEEKAYFDQWATDARKAWRARFGRSSLKHFRPWATYSVVRIEGRTTVLTSDDRLATDAVERAMRRGVAAQVVLSGIDGVDVTGSFYRQGLESPELIEPSSDEVDRLVERVLEERARRPGRGHESEAKESRRRRWLDRFGVNPPEEA